MAKYMRFQEVNEMEVLLTIDLDGEAGMASIRPPDQPFWISQGEYGPRVGAKRLLKLLEKHGVKATFCVVGQVAEKYPDLIRDIHDKGHEIAMHGYTHKPYLELTEEEEIAELKKTSEILEQITGEKPLGHRTPLWNPSPRTLKNLEQMGVMWNSDFLNDDESYLHKEAKIVEIPPSHSLNDWAQLIQFRVPPADMLDIWKKEFDVLYKEGKQFVLTLHPFEIGRPARIQVLDEIITYAKGHEGVEFMRCIDVARKVLGGEGK
jgi:peptidoglycan/xylan/chitin deacetylase (PgdA/CDA1 family)